MNRFKFRIWDHQHKTWLSNSSSLHCSSNWTICPFTGELVDYVEAVDGDGCTAYPADKHYRSGKIKKPRYVIQQFTGLRDCKKKPIFEGDILKISFGAEGELPKIVDVKFERAWFACDGTALSILDSGFHDVIEVIGNIFERGYLLKTT